MNMEEKIRRAKQEFEKSFLEKDFYEKQTADDAHLNLLLNLAGSMEKSTILDLGTGTGYLAFPLAQKYRNSFVIGLDIVTQALERSREKAKEAGLDHLTFVSYDGLRFPFADQSVDLIITRYVLHHVPELVSCAREMHRVLKPGGRVIISDPTPNEKDICGFVDRFMGKKPDGHVKFYPLEEYKEILGAAGFCFMGNKTTSIRFPRRQAGQYANLLAETDQEILKAYQVVVQGEEIWITEQVLNMVFMKALT